MLENLSVKEPLKNSTSTKRLNTTDRLSLIGLIHDGILHGGDNSPLASDLYEDLTNLVGSTVSGAKIDKLNVGKSTKGFKTFEINSEAGENLGRLNMLYLNKPIPCFYLVYVEVAAPFRNKGLGNLVLREFRDFLIEKSAIGVLDNIIPSNDPTFEIYRKLDWRRIFERHSRICAEKTARTKRTPTWSMSRRHSKEKIYKLPSLDSCTTSGEDVKPLT
ncbi:MAG: hypothetical protein M1511_06730 [Deltaproteobacteria bacterium]|nr:hypothetical protein [Deltaproteobacteria bacterium]